MKHRIITETPDGNKHQLVKNSQFDSCSTCSIYGYCTPFLSESLMCIDASGRLDMHYEKIS